MVVLPMPGEAQFGLKMRLKFGEIWGNPKSLCHISVNYLKIPPYFHVFNDSLQGDDIISLDQY